MKNTPLFYLNSNNGNSLLAFGEGSTLQSDKGLNEKHLQEYLGKNEGNHLFCFLAYDLKNEFENLTSNNRDFKNFCDFFIWNPMYVVELSRNRNTWLQGAKNEESEKFVQDFQNSLTYESQGKQKVDFKNLISRADYLKSIELIKNHIQQGDIYELNFCQEYLAENVELEKPIQLYNAVNAKTQAPFSCLVRFNEYTIVSGSPERYIQKKGRRLLSQPIKGTAPRSHDKVKDKELLEQLRNDEKERAENIMIVDLVRNDLSRLAEKRSVRVEELCEIYSFETVHQMISTVACTLKEDTSFYDIIKATFPMGSMTGAPKIRAMELIEQYENFKRGPYSGSVGHIKPNGDFDLNVLIRTLFHNAHSNILTCDVGGAITIKSDPEKEYEECQTKISKLINDLYID